MWSPARRRACAVSSTLSVTTPGATTRPPRCPHHLGLQQRHRRRVADLLRHRGELTAGQRRPESGATARSPDGSRRSLRALALAARSGRPPPGKVSLSEVCSDGASVYWLESRPCDGGRVVFVRVRRRRGGGSLRPRGEHSQPRARIRRWCVMPRPGARRGVRLRGGVRPTGVVASGRRRHRGRSTPEPPDGERWAHGGLGASADGAWVVAVREVHVAGDAAPRGVRRRPGHRSGERRANRFSPRVTISMVPPGSMRRRNASPSSPGITPTCRGTARPSWSSHSW